MSRHRHSSGPLVALLCLVAAMLLPLPTPAGAQSGHHRLIPSAVPASTPNLLDGTTLTGLAVAPGSYGGQPALTDAASRGASLSIALH